MIENVAEKLPEWIKRRFVGLSKPELKAACAHLEINTTAHDTLDSLTRKLLTANSMWDDGGSDGASAPETARAPKVPKPAPTASKQWREAAEADPVQRADNPNLKAKKPVLQDVASTERPIPAKPKLAPPRVVKPVEVDPRKKRTPPNLRSLTNWQGRRYRIRALPQDKERGGARPIPIGWENEVYFLNPKKKFQDVPAPVFHNVVDSQAAELLLEWNAKTGQTDKSWNVYARFPISFMGPSPGTEHLPESLREWYAQDAEDNELYAHEDRDFLEHAWAQLTDGNRPNERDRDRNIGYWRREVLQLLGLTVEQKEADEEAEQREAARAVNEPEEEDAWA